VGSKARSGMNPSQASDLREDDRTFLSARPNPRFVKVGVIGVGSMGQNHARVLAELGDLAAVADPDAKAGGSVANRFSVSYFPDYNGLLAERIDAVTICVPTNLHFKVIMDLAIHDIDVLRYLVGKRVSSVFAVGGRQKHEAFEDHATILLSFTNGVNGYVEANWLTPMKVRRLSLTCLRNFVELDYTAQS